MYILCASHYVVLKSRCSQSTYGYYYRVVIRWTMHIECIAPTKCPPPKGHWKVGNGGATCILLLSDPPRLAISTGKVLRTPASPRGEEMQIHDLPLISILIGTWVFFRYYSNTKSGNGGSKWKTSDQHKRWRTTGHALSRSINNHFNRSKIMLFFLDFFNYIFYIGALDKSGDHLIF